MSSPKTVDVRFQLTVLRCQAGDEQAFAQIMGVFESRTLAYLSALVGHDAEDVQQEVWLSVFRNIHELADPAAFRTWLFRVARHRAIDWLRKRKRERDLLDTASLEFNGAVEDESETVERMDDGALQRALAGLPPPQREVLLLRYRDELSYQEMAQIIGCPIGTIRTRLHHAKKKFSEHLQRATP